MPASIHSVVENDFVTRLALNAVFADIPGSLDAESSKWPYLAAIGGLNDQKEWSDGSRFQYSNFGNQLDIMGSSRPNLFVQINPRVGDGRDRFGTWSGHVDYELRNSTRVLGVVCQLVIGSTDPVEV